MKTADLPSENQQILAIIPARMGSSRFPGKPLALINGIPMIGHVYKNISNAPHIADVIVATCDKEIADYITSIGGLAVMTSSAHERASDRCAEALLLMEQMKPKRYDIVLMVQGDEPMTHPGMVAEVLAPMIRDPSIQVANLMAEISSLDEFNDRNCIKVVCDLAGDAIYFSREPIPTLVRGENTHMRKQVCLIPFRRDYLLLYTGLEPTPLEIAESIDMLRVIEHGQKVKMIPTSYQTFAVDTPADLAKVSELMLSM